MVEGGNVAAERRSPRLWRLTVTPTHESNITIGLDHTVVTGANERPVSPIDPVTVYGKSLVSVADSQARESQGRMRFTARLDKPAQARVTVAWTTDDDAPDTAAAGRDYETGSGRLVFEPGDVEETFIVKVFATTEKEEDETFTVTLSATMTTTRTPAKAGRLPVSPPLLVASASIPGRAVVVVGSSSRCAQRGRSDALFSSALSPNSFPVVSLPA